MNYEVIQDKNNAEDWRVEGIDPDNGDIAVTLFSGCEAEQRARAYYKAMLPRVSLQVYEQGDTVTIAGSKLSGDVTQIVIHCETLETPAQIASAARYIIKLLEA